MLISEEAVDVISILLLIFFSFCLGWNMAIVSNKDKKPETAISQYRFLQKCPNSATVEYRSDKRRSADEVCAE